MMSERELVSIEEACEIAGVSRRSISAQEQG